MWQVGTQISLANASLSFIIFHTLAPLIFQ